MTLCFCNEIKIIETKARISIIMHHRETHLTSNTANLARLVLPKCQILLRGHPENPFTVDSLGLTSDETPLYLFPHEDALELSSDFLNSYSNKKFHLIIPDGTWSQAVKCFRRESGLQNIQCVKLPPGMPGRYRLRKSSSEDRLSTYEAIARALGIIENNEETRINMEVVFDMMVERVIRGRTAFEN